MDTTYSHDSLYPDKWDKPTIIYESESKKNVYGTYKGPKAQVITNNIKNDKDKYIPPLHIITRDSGYSYNSNYGYLDDSNTDNINPDILDNYYYSSQRTNITKELNNEDKECKINNDEVREGRRIIDSIKGSGRIVPSNNDTSQYINDINGKENKVVCVGCSCCGGVTDTVYNLPKQNIVKKVDSKDSNIPQLEPRYTSVIVPTNGYTWASTPMPNTDNYYVDTIKRSYSPILFSQNNKQLGYRYEQIKTGKLNDNKESFILNTYISPENKKKYNQVNRYILFITIIVIVFIIVKYKIYPFV